MTSTDRSYKAEALERLRITSMSSYFPVQTDGDGFYYHGRLSSEMTHADLVKLVLKFCQEHRDERTYVLERMQKLGS
jgi:hypothetical protein